jgi:hypothetical protein
MKYFKKNHFFRLLGINIFEIERRMVSLKSEKNSKKNALFSYVLDPFLLKNPGDFPISHAKHWESFQIVKILLELGFNVDVINYDNMNFSPKKNYDLFIGSRVNFHQIAQLLHPDCTKVAHLTVSHWCYHNKGLFDRLLSIQEKKGVTLYPVKAVETNLAIEYADFATMLGNDFTINTYRYANKPIFPIRSSTNVLFPWMENKQFDECRKNFIWFGSDGLVYKGLDLVLDAFSEMPDYTLTVCGPISEEKDFERAYQRELYQTTNINTVGWVNTNSDRFQNIIKNSIAFVFPTCGEGQAGAVIACMHASLIPIVSAQAGVDMKTDFSVLLKKCTKQEIKEAVTYISQLETHELERMSKNVWENARNNYNRDVFLHDYKNALLFILKQKNMISE